MIQFNPLLSYLDGGARAAITTPPSASLVFDLPGRAIWAKGVKLKGTDHTYTFQNDNYITLTNTPGADESEDIEIGVNIQLLKAAIDTTYDIVTTTINGLAPAFSAANTGGAVNSGYFLGWVNNTLKWYQHTWRNVRINADTTDCLSTTDTDPLIINSGNGIAVTWDSVNKVITITNTKPDTGVPTDYKVTQGLVSTNDDYRILLKKTADDTNETTFVNYASSLIYNPSTRILKINNLRVVTVADVMTGATSSTAGTRGLVPDSVVGDQVKFLRGDGTWALPINTNRAIYLNGTQLLADTSLVGLNFIGNGLIFKAAGTGSDLSGSTDYATLLIQGGAGTGTLTFKANTIRTVDTFTPTLNTDVVIDITTGTSRGTIAINNIEVEVAGPMAFLGDDPNSSSLIMPDFDPFVHTVHTVPQLLSNDQKQLARTNIGAIALTDLPHTVIQTFADNDIDRPILLKNGGGTPTINSTVLFSGVKINASTNTIKTANLQATGYVSIGSLLRFANSSYNLDLINSGNTFVLQIEDDPDPINIFSIAIPSGNITYNAGASFVGQITSLVALNTAPFVITSTTLNDNLNADLLDGKHLNEIFTVFEDAGSQSTRLVIGGVQKTLNIDADTVDGLHVHSGINSEANKIVRTNASGVIVSGLINTTTDNLGNTATGKVYLAASGSNDIKYKPFTDFVNEIRSSEVVEYTKNLAPTTSWAATGIATTDLDTGTYIVLLSTGTHYLSGVMSWYANTGGMAEEIALHYAGSGSPVRVYLRTYNGTLEIAADSAWSATDFTFKFKKEIL